MARNLGQPFNRMPEDRDREFKELEQRLAQEALDQQTKKNSPGITNMAGWEYWRIENVNYRGRNCVVDLSQNLLGNGAKLTQVDWSEFRKLAMPMPDFYTGSMPLHHAVFRALYLQRDKPEAEEARKFIQEQIRINGLMTLTRIVYSPHGKDKTIHNFGLWKQKYSFDEEIIGPTREIEQADSLALNSLLETGDINEINAVYNWINQTPPWIWRISPKPYIELDCVAEFGTNTGSTGLHCFEPSYKSGLSLGMRVVSPGDIK